MAGTVQDIQSDIAFMKSLATQGTRAPSIVGAHMVAAGLIYGLCVAAAWAAMVGLISMSAAWSNTVGLWATAIYLPVMLWLFWVGRKTPSGAGARAFAAGWGGIGLSSVTILVTLVVVGFRLKNPTFVAHAWPPVAFALYGGAWLTFTVASRRPAWILVSLGAYGTAIVISALTGDPALWLAFAAGLILWMAAPGAVLMWQGRRPAG